MNPFHKAQLDSDSAVALFFTIFLAFALSLVGVVIGVGFVLL